MAREGEHGSIEDFVNEALDLAEANGLNGNGLQKDFAEICLAHGLEKVRMAIEPGQSLKVQPQDYLEQLRLALAQNTNPETLV